MSGDLRPDHMRGLTVHFSTSVERTERVELCPGARVYHYCLSAEYTGPGQPDPDMPLARLLLQDSSIDCYPDAFVGADLPGLAWPAAARLEMAADARVTLVLTYGHCS